MNTFTYTTNSSPSLALSAYKGSILERCFFLVIFAPIFLLVGPNTVSAQGNSSVATNEAPVFTNLAAGELGEGRTCARSKSGQIYCWGAEPLGLAGTAKGTDYAYRPVAVANQFQARSLSAEYATVCALKESGQLYCWGRNDDYQLGGGRLKPGVGYFDVPLPVADSLKFQEVGVGAGYICGLTVDGTVYCWGEDSFNKLGGGDSDAYTRVGTHVEYAKAISVPSTVEKLSVGYTHACALTKDGTAFCWGRNRFGALGIGKSTRAEGPTKVVGGHQFKKIATGNEFTCGITRQEALYCWGWNASKRLGDSELDHSSSTSYPVPQKIAPAGKFLSVEAGNGHACARSSEGKMYCWGANSAGQVGDGTDTNRGDPTEVNLRAPVQEMALAQTHTCVLTEEGTVYCWGNNAHGALGIGETEGPRDDGVSPTPVQVVDVSRQQRNQTPEVHIVVESMPDLGDNPYVTDGMQYEGGALYFRVRQREAITFHAVAMDYEDGLLTGKQLQWTFPDETKSATGTVVSRTMTVAPETQQKVTVKATDLDGATASFPAYVKVKPLSDDGN